MNTPTAAVPELMVSVLRCPDCKADVTPVDDGLCCSGCGRRFDLAFGVPVMLPAESEAIKDEMREFWGKGYEFRFSEWERQLTAEQFRAVLDTAVEEAVSEGQFFGREIDLTRVRGLRCLEIGCGGGGHALVLGTHGAQIVSTDLCLERTVPAARKIGMLNIDGAACQADAEQLPFKDNTFDVVISYGVLHHTPKTEEAIEHVRRVLKPGGRAYILLYARHSFQYYVTELLYMGIVRGALFRYGRQWLSAVTEMAQVRPGQPRNPLTKVYGVRETRAMFSEFSSVRVRKGDFSFTQIPGFERLERRLHPERYGPQAPRRRGTAFERWLGSHMGFSLYITATK